MRRAPLLLLLLAGLARPAGAAQLQAPETELALARTELDNLQRRLDTARQLNGRLGLGPQTASAERSWRNAQAFFAHQEWLSATRELNNFLNQTQVPEPKSYLRSQYMLGRAYEEMGYKTKSLRAYFRYLAASLTAKTQDQGELVDVLRRMLPLAAAETGTRSELNQLLASVTSIDLPKDAEPAIFYYAAKAAANSGQAQVAAAWLDRTAVTASDPALRAKALYMRALLAITKQDFALAEDILGEVIQTDPEGSARDIARLALARLAVHQKKRETALKYYALIPEASPAYKDATFESVYVHLDLKQDGAARAKAQLFAARWPDGPEALQLRTLLAYLDVRAGDLESAQQSIAAADGRLRDINDWIVQKLAGRGAVSQATLADLVTITGNQLPIAPSVKDAAQLFARLAEAERRLGDLRGDIRNTLYTIGRADLAHLRPAWVNRAEQLATLGDDLLKVGHRLAGAERHLYEGRLDAVDAQRLAASETRRTRLLTPPASAHRKLVGWATYAASLEMTRGIAKAVAKLRTAEAQLAAARYLAATSKSVRPAATRQQRLAELGSAAGKLTSGAAHALDLLRARTTRDLLAQSPHRAVTRFLSQYAAALHEEEGILAKARDGAATGATRLNADDAARAWRQWEFLTGEVFRQLTDLDREIAGGLGGMLAELETEEARYDELAAGLRTTTSELEGRLGLSLASIAGQYTNAINMRFARHQKWRADIDWLTYQSELDKERKVTDRYNLEQQILRDNLTDLQQGVLWQWPK